MKMAAGRLGGTRRAAVISEEDGGAMNRGGSLGLWTVKHGCCMQRPVKMMKENNGGTVLESRLSHGGGGEVKDNGRWAWLKGGAWDCELGSRDEAVKKREGGCGHAGKVAAKKGGPAVRRMAFAVGGELDGGHGEKVLGARRRRRCVFVGAVEGGYAEGDGILKEVAAAMVKMGGEQEAAELGGGCGLRWEWEQWRRWLAGGKDLWLSPEGDGGRGRWRRSKWTRGRLPVVRRRAVVRTGGEGNGNCGWKMAYLEKTMNSMDRFKICAAPKVVLFASNFDSQLI